ncbi:MAG: hypothetical protein II039_02840, partial [Treponema sp.]|nr:hypothetical protein [Treponema sp.]
MDFLWIAESLCNSARAKPPSVALYFLARKKKIPPWRFTVWQERKNPPTVSDVVPEVVPEALEGLSKGRFN